MKSLPIGPHHVALLMAGSFALALHAQTPPAPPPGSGDPPPFERRGPGRPAGPGGFGGMMSQETRLVDRFDRDGDKRLNAEERKAAREFLEKERAEGRGQRGFGGPGGPGGRGGRGGARGGNQEPPQPGERLTPADVKSFPDAPLYDPATLRTIFLEFEGPDWEKEMINFNNTDVEVPATVTVDGKVYRDVGVHFRGMSSFGVGEGRKRSLNLSFDFVHADQRLGGYRTMNLLNSHGDPTFLRAVLYQHVAREYIPTPKANFVRVVINGESWGIYVNSQQFNKDFVHDGFGTTKGARWKAPGSPGGRASLAYLGEDVEQYKRAYSIKSKDDPERWADLVRLCRVLNETPREELEAALSPMLEIDGALKFLALENALINNDGYWVRTSDYNLYQDDKGRFHIIPHDTNETFARPGGPGFGGGPGGRGGPGGFGPGAMLAPSILSEADKNRDRKLTMEEFTALAEAWFDKLDVDKAGQLTHGKFIAGFGGLLPQPERFGPPGGGPGPGPGRGFGGGPPGFNPATIVAQPLFDAADQNKDNLVTRGELKESFARSFAGWTRGRNGTLDEEGLAAGLISALPPPTFGGRGGPPGGGPAGPTPQGDILVGPGGGSEFGGRGSARGPGGPAFSNMPRVDGVKLDPLIAAEDAGKPLISRLLAVPALRERYLGYVREIAEKWLDWEKLGPIARQYQSLIAEDVAKDTRKLDSTEAFIRGLAEDVGGDGPMRGSIGLKTFADERREYLLNYKEPQKSVK